MEGRRSSIDVVLEGKDAAVEPEMPKEYVEGLAGAEHDFWDTFEVHWNFLRNVFPQKMRCQEREDAVTDNYCDQLGPRSLGPRDKKGMPQSCLPTSHSGVPTSKSEADYKANVMPNTILPMWEYVNDASKDAVSLPAAMERGYALSGAPSDLVENMMTAMDCDPNFNQQQCIKARFVNEPYLMTQKEHDTAMDDKEMREWNGSLEKLKEFARDRPDAPVDNLQCVPGVPFLDRTRDKYELLTWQWIRCRIQEEDEEIAKHSVRLIPNAFLQIACAIGIWALGASEIDGGRVEVVIASFTVGIVTIISCVVGVVGVLAENEQFLRMFWIGQLWSLSLLTAFLYVELHHVQANDYACNPSSDLAGGGTKGDCDGDTRVIVASIILCFIQVLFGFMSVYMTTALLDSINDKTVIEDSLEVYKYLQYYLNELFRRGGLKSSSYDADDCVDTLNGPDRVKNANGLWATREDIATDNDCDAAAE